MGDQKIAIGPFRFEARTGQLWGGTREMKLTPRAAAVLSTLAKRPQELVTKQELLDEAWNGIAVSDDALTSCMKELRQALSDDARQPRFIETLHRRGYRLMVPAKAIHDEMGVIVRGNPPLPEKPSIVVLPFDNLSADPHQEFLADGIVESITAALSCIRSFFVIARNSAFTYKGRAVKVSDVRSELGVAYLLEGSVQISGNRIRIIAQLVETEGGSHVWSGRHDGTLDDIFDLQDRITAQVAGELQPSIRLAEIERSRRKRPQDLNAYDYTMRALPRVWALHKDDSAIAIELLDKALAIDPEYPLALSLAGWCHAQRSVYNWTEELAASQSAARQLAERAAELSRDDSLILAVLGAIHTFLRNRGTARVLLERAITLDPNAAWAWSRLGWLENYSDRPERAREHFEHAIRLSPLDPMNFNNYIGIGSSYEVGQEYDKAVAFYRRVIEERPRTWWNCRNMASALAGAGRMDEAREAYALVRRIYPNLTASKFRQAMVFTDETLDRMVANLKKLGLPD